MHWKDYLTKDYYVDYAKTKQTNKDAKANGEKAQIQWEHPGQKKICTDSSQA